MESRDAVEESIKKLRDFVSAYHQRTEILSNAITSQLEQYRQTFGGDPDLDGLEIPLSADIDTMIPLAPTHTPILMSPKAKKGGWKKN
jgi:hypothetical protein